MALCRPSWSRKNAGGLTDGPRSRAKCARLTRSLSPLSLPTHQ
jgi:hypothetical protein